MRSSPRSNPPTRFLFLLLFGLPFVALIAPLPASATYSITGRWTPPADWHLEGTQVDKLKYAVHMVLIRGDGDPYHSRVLWWRAEKQDEFRGGQWGWKAPTSGDD